MGLTAGRQEGRVDKVWMGLKTFKILNRLNLSGFYFVYYCCNVTTILEVHFSWLVSSKAYFKCKKLVAIFMSIPTIRY